jgi:broad specificity phosphatase PhoE
MNQETNIFLARHGETEWNTQNRLQGNQNSPLTRNELKRVKGVGGT